MSMPSIKSKAITIEQEMPISKTLKFWQGLKDNKIYATKCVKCEKLFFPPTSDCPYCLSSKMKWHQLSSEAEIETFTHVVIRPFSFQQERPYTVAVGKVKDGVRVLAWLTGHKMSEIKVGMKVKLTAKTTPEGNLTYEFVPLHR